eukprot:NODE_157_length_15108_cov_0.423079.p12 type:complete len:134 gc:universal NODE_157_length_15108_cov_0.423079:2142-2543(+)
MFKHFFRRASRIETSELHSKEHIDRIAKELSEAQKLWDNGESVKFKHLAMISASAVIVFGIFYLKNDKENAISQYIVHKMTPESINDKKQLKTLLTHQELSENRLIIDKLVTPQFSTKDPYLQERGSPFNTHY